MLDLKFSFLLNYHQFIFTNLVINFQYFYFLIIIFNFIFRLIIILYHVAFYKSSCKHHIKLFYQNYIFFHKSHIEHTLHYQFFLDHFTIISKPSSIIKNFVCTLLHNIIHYRQILMIIKEFKIIIVQNFDFFKDKVIY